MLTGAADDITQKHKLRRLSAAVVDYFHFKKLKLI